jgi:RNA polymerase sigma-70 factor, ECF subfamily
MGGKTVESRTALLNDPGIGSPHTTALPEDERLIAALRRGDEAAFAQLLDAYHTSMIRLALLYVASHAVAEEVVQETWLEVFRGLERFQERCALKTWIFRILTNVAKTRGQREARSVPFSALEDPDREPVEPAVAPERFRAAEPWQGHWAAEPRSWEDLPEERLLSAETRECIATAIAALSPVQQEVISLRDVKGWTAEEVCSVLGVSAANQRVLLHHARSKVRGALEQYFDQVAVGPS